MFWNIDRCTYLFSDRFHCQGVSENRLARLVDLGVDHLSVYDLQYEPGTAFGKRFPVAGDNGRPSSDKAAEMYEAV